MNPILVKYKDSEGVVYHQTVGPQFASRSSDLLSFVRNICEGMKKKLVALYVYDMRTKGSKMTPILAPPDAKDQRLGLAGRRIVKRYKNKAKEGTAVTSNDRFELFKCVKSLVYKENRNA